MDGATSARRWPDDSGKWPTLQIGTFVKAGDKLGAVVPAGSLKLVADFLPAVALGRVQAGQPARLRLDSFPWTQYGSLAATVSSVASEVRDGRVRVELAVDSEPAARLPLQHGLRGTVEVEVERVAPATLVLRAAGQLLAHPGPGWRPGREHEGTMRGVARPQRRRLLVPEVVQTSAMDCGPAALKCLLEGFGIPVSYGRLREACQTGVDGTSIDTLEEVAVQLGLEAEQIMVPVDHVLLPEAQTLPALVVVRLPDGKTHFVVAWRRHGRFVQVMDPATGRRWPTCRQFLHHSTSTPCRFPPLPGAPGPARMNASTCCTTAWRGWGSPAGSQRACSMPLWRSRDGAPWPPWTRRCVWSLPWCALAVCAAVSRQRACWRRAWPTHRPTQQTTCRGIPAAFWSVRPAPPGPEGEAQVLLRGAVLVRIRGRRAVDYSVAVDGLSEPDGATVTALA